MDKPWHIIKNVDEIPTPALVVYEDRVQENIRRMIAMAGGTARLRPHIKTHKMAEIVKLHLAAGITKFKCATIAEAEMAAQAGAPDVLIAYQPVGPNINRLLQLTRKFPQARFSTIADDGPTIVKIAKAFAGEPKPLPVFLDVDCGMGRTGASPGEQGIELYRLLGNQKGIEPAGLHAYDGHIHESNLTARRRVCSEAFSAVEKLRIELRKHLPVPVIVAGGTPTFALHAHYPDRECSPGTCVLWDFGYHDHFADLDFNIAALVLARVVSKPGHNHLCVDLGHKAIASENPPPRVQFLNLPEAKPIMHNEEHLLLDTPKAVEFHVGDVLYGVPRHICPTVALHDRAFVVRDGSSQETWPILARSRVISI